MAQVSPDELAEQLRRLSLATTQYAAALARAMNLGMSEVLAMQHLYKVEGFTIGTLGERLSMTSGAVTALVDRLEARGYLQRHPHPTDRRSSVLTLTPSGVNAAIEHIGPLFHDMAATVGELSDLERTQIAQLLERIIAIQRTHAQQMGAAGQRSAREPKND